MSNVFQTSKHPHESLHCVLVWAISKPVLTINDARFLGNINFTQSSETDDLKNKKKSRRVPATLQGG